MSDFEREDMELAEMMGGQFIDETKEETFTMTDFKPEPDTANKKPHAMEIPVEAQWEPAKPAANDIDRLKATAKDVSLYAIVSMVLFWWQQTDKIDYTTAWYALLVCVGMVFFSIGRHWGRK